MQNYKNTGSILILVLWTLFFLAAVSVAVGSYVAAGIMLASHIQDYTRLKAVAIAGAEKAGMEIMRRATNGWDGIQENAWNREKDVFAGVIGKGNFSTVWKEILSDSGSVEQYGVIGEESKININKVSKQVIAALFTRLNAKGDVEALAEAVVAKRESAGTLLSGELKESASKEMDGKEYKDISELLSIPGMTEEMLDEAMPYLTVFGSGKININSAPQKVIAALADGTRGIRSDTHDSLARKIDIFRESGRYFKTLDEKSMIDELSDFAQLTAEEKMVFTAIMPQITVSSTCFEGCVVAKLNNSSKKCFMSFVFDYTCNFMLIMAER